ncbi:MAG: hypothetical protein IJ816_02335 [Alloprevotella sp.]|nr:hypothetical protein [Alloprevotella sp.]
MKSDLLQFCRYYKGEDKSPFEDGRSIWWMLERYAVNAGDKTNKDLSPTMINYIRERIWQSDSGWNTNWSEALYRAKTLYEQGKWNAGYIADKSTSISIAF